MNGTLKTPLKIDENLEPPVGAYSGPNRPLIPIESGHLFRGKPAGDSGAK